MLKNRPPSRNLSAVELAIEDLKGKPWNGKTGSAHRIDALPYQGNFFAPYTVTYESDAAIQLPFPTQSGLVISNIYAEVDKIFDGSGTKILIGDKDDEDGFLTIDVAALGILGWYGYDPQYRGAYLWNGKNPIHKVYPANTTRPIITFTNGSATQGSCTVYIEYALLKII